MADGKSIPIPADPRDWRPQRADGARGVPYLDNPIAEPIWSGRRVLVFYREAERDDEWGSIDVLDEDGEDGLDSASRAFDQLRRSVIARDAVIDGIVTDQVTDAVEAGVHRPRSELLAVRVLVVGAQRRGDAETERAA